MSRADTSGARTSTDGSGLDPPALALSADLVVIDPIEHYRVSVPGGTVEVIMRLHRDLRICSAAPETPPWRFIAGAAISPPLGLSVSRGLTPVVRRAAIRRFRAMLTDRGFEALEDEGRTTVETPAGPTPVRRLRARVLAADAHHQAVAMIAVLARDDGWAAIAGASVLDHPDDPVPAAAVPGVLTDAIGALRL